MKTIHNGKQTTEYRAYHNARNRCLNPRVPKYVIYGARGIEFRFSSFQQFVEEVGLNPCPRHVLDRINVDGHYEPGNIRWVSPTVSCFNQRIRKDNTSGRKGITFVPRMKRRPWRARIEVGKEQLHLGYFSTPDEAAEAHRKMTEQIVRYYWAVEEHIVEGDE